MELHTQSSAHDDEIDLFDLLDDIKQKWYWLIGAGFICTLLAGIYAFLASPVYKTDLILKPIAEADLIQLNQPRLKDVFDVPEDKLFLTAENAFGAVRTTALSGSVLRDFYSVLIAENEGALLGLIYNDDLSSEQNFVQFARRFSMINPGSKQDDVFFKITFELSDAYYASVVLNRFSEYLINRHQAETRRSIELRIALKLEQWHMQADELRNRYQAEKQRQIFRIEESAAIAASLNQKRPLYDAERVSVGAQPPMFMMGETALRSEIEQLNNRSKQNEDLYIVNLPELLWKIKTVEGASIAWQQVKYVVVDQPAMIPVSAIKPRKLLILALGVVAGGMAGIMMALIAAAYGRRKVRVSV